jgi:MFS transporter, AAHS family, 4-hydroxybenzoate transporter
MDSKLGMNAAINVGQLIDSRPVGAFQWRVFLTCMAITLLDGIDLQTIGVAAPALAKLWGLQRQALGPVFAAAPAGMMAGALLLGPIADRIGRKRLIVISTLLFGCFSLLTPQARDLRELVALRFLTGVGLGGVLPNLIAMVTEYAPAARRGFFITLVSAALPVGSTLVALLSPWLIGNYGWSSVFYLGGVLPIVVALLAFIFLPESLRFLAPIAARRSEALGIIRRLAPELALPNDLQIATSAAAPKGVPIGQLFGRSRTGTTLMSALVVGLNLFMINLLVNWLPTLLTQTGLGSNAALLSTAVLNMAGAFGGLMWGRLLDRYGVHKAMTSAALASAVAMVCLALGSGTPWILVATLTVVGWCVLGAQPGFYAMLAGTYPTRMRSTGIGTVLAIGRIGSIFGPAIAGLLVAAGLGSQGIFLVVAAAGLLCATGIAMLSRLRPDFGGD